MKRFFLFALFLVTASCGNDAPTPTAPSSLLSSSIATEAQTISTDTVDVDTGGVAAVSVPFHILHPVSFPMSAGVINFPPRNEPNEFFRYLQTLYRDTLRRPQTTTFVDSEGQSVWLTEYFRFYLNGCSHEEAMARTLREITAGAPEPTCGIEHLNFPPRNLPFEFQGRLEATYRDILRRSTTLTYVDSEGTNVWLAEYLRFRVVGNCGHTAAEDRVIAEIRGGPPIIVIDSPRHRPGLCSEWGMGNLDVGLKTTFRWHMENPEPGEVYQYDIRFDKGVDACNGFIERSYPAGTNTCLAVDVSNTYLPDVSAAWAVRAINSRGRVFCTGAGSLFFRRDKPADPPC